VILGLLNEALLKIYPPLEEADKKIAEMIDELNQFNEKIASMIVDHLNAATSELDKHASNVCAEKAELLSKLVNGQ
jgi:hypothetical protein